MKGYIEEEPRWWPEPRKRWSEPRRRPQMPALVPALTPLSRPRFVASANLPIRLEAAGGASGLTVHGSSALGPTPRPPTQLRGLQPAPPFVREKGGRWRRPWPPRGGGRGKASASRDVLGPPAAKPED